MRARLRAFFDMLLEEHTTPTRLALGVVLGCVVGCLPLFGLHFPLCLAVALALRLNKLVVYGAANLSIPPMVPILGFTSVQLGELLRHGRFLALTRAEFTWQNAKPMAAQFFVNWMLGGAVLGLLVGGFFGSLVYAAAQKKLRDREGAMGRAIREAITRASRRFDTAHPRYKWYARSKYRLDPCYRAIAPYVAANTLTVDLGTGLGMLPLVLAELGDGRAAHGIEWDKDKVEVAKAAAAGLPNVTLEEGDVRTAAIPACDVLTLVDMLHYYEPEVQRQLLSRCRQALRPSGKLLVREGDAQRRGGARFTRWVENLAVRIGWNRGPQVKFRPKEDLIADLAALGLTVAVDEVAGQLHPGNVLLVATLPAIASEPEVQDVAADPAQHAEDSAS